MPPLRMNRRNETPAVDPALAATVQQVVRALLPELTTEIAASMNNVNNANNPNNLNSKNGRSGGNRNGGNGGDALATIYVWLERFQKQKPLTFSLAPTPVEADNWIAHIEKFFKVLGCDDQFKARLATYKLKGDAHSWWRAYKQAKGGDAHVETLSWNDFRAIFFLPYFPRLEQEKYEREYKSVCQRDGESSAKVYDKVFEVANAARNIEILQKEMFALTPNENKKRTRENEQDENEARAGKQRDNHRNEWRQNTKHSHGRDCYPRRLNAAYSDSAPVTKCNTCGKRHPSDTCYKATGACYNCGQIRHKAIDCKSKDGTSSKNNDGNNSPKTTTGGRVFAMTTTQFAKP
ncbi:putative reverse transcriptase domain-containing protein [Tanacetum coccineum]